MSMTQKHLGRVLGGTTFETDKGAATVGGISLGVANRDFLRQPITLTNVTGVMTGTTDGGYLAINTFQLPASVPINIVGISSSVSVDGLAVAATVDTGIGTAPVTAGATTLSGTQTDVFPSATVAMTTAGGSVAGASVPNVTVASGGALYLNFAATGASTSVNDTVTINGAVDLSYFSLA